jgi:DNA-binding transcriptional regulator YhcF (GntR family)
MDPQLELRVDRGGGVPLGTQLAWRLRGLIDSGELAPGNRLPSIRELATAADVNVNTVRAVYARLEREGVVHSEHGRGTFVTAPETGRGERGRLRRQIAALEEELSRRPPLPSAGAVPPAPARRGGNLLTTDELATVRDDLIERLRRLDVARAEVIQSLQALTAAERAEIADLAAEAEPARVSTAGTASLSGARVRWVGA